MIFALMKKNEPIIGLDISADGQINTVSRKITNPELLPIAYKNTEHGLEQWWRERSVPTSRDYIHDMLQKNDVSCPEEYLMINLGLSLTDHYWIRPVKSDLSWEDVNLYQNDFKNEILIDLKENNHHTISYSPNSSLQGNLEKSWNIINGERVLIKGNHSDKSIESLNEVFASGFHEMQGFTNYVQYDFIKIHNKDYKYGCVSKLFTNESYELVSAHDLICSEKKRNEVSTYEQLIALAVRYGADESAVRRQLEYQILSDFILTNTDRHLNNIGFLINSETMKIEKMAPIFDTGKSMFVDQDDISSTKELLSIKTNSFSKNEISLLKYVTDRNLVDLSKIPDSSSIRQLYEKDEKIRENYIRRVCEAYEKKVDLFRDFQLGKDLNRVKISLPRKC